MIGSAVDAMGRDVLALALVTIAIFKSFSSICFFTKSTPVTADASVERMRIAPFPGFTFAESGAIASGAGGTASGSGAGNSLASFTGAGIDSPTGMICAAGMLQASKGSDSPSMIVSGNAEKPHAPVGQLLPAGHWFSHVGSGHSHDDHSFK